MDTPNANPSATACTAAAGVRADRDMPVVPTRYYRRRFRIALIALGIVCVAFGAVGVVVPGLPTTPFLLVALWAFSKSSERFHRWLWHHRTLGPPIRDWHLHRRIPRRAKAVAIGTMGSSVAIIGLFIAESWLFTVAVAACMAPPAVYILTRPSRPRD